MALRDDILAELMRLRPEQVDGAVADEPVERLANVLLLDIRRRGGSVARVVSGPAARVEMRMRGRWSDAFPRLSDAGGELRDRLCRRLIERLTMMSRTDARPPYASGTLRLVVASGAEIDRTESFHVFRVALVGGAALLVTRLRWDDPPSSKRGGDENVRNLLQESHKLLSSGRAAAGIAVLEPALRLSRDDPSVSPLSVVDVLDGLAVLEEALGRLDAAESYLSRAIAASDAALGVDNVTAAFLRVLLACMELDRKRVDVAVRHLERARETFDALVGEASGALALEVQRARASRMMGEQGAERWLEELTVRAASFHDVGSEGVAAYEHGLAAAERGDRALAAARMRHALGKLDTQPFTAEIELELARVLRADGREAEALALLRHASEVLAAHRAPDHPDRVTAEIELARFKPSDTPYR